jgi:hypothetical protein
LFALGFFRSLRVAGQRQEEDETSGYGWVLGVKIKPVLGVQNKSAAVDRLLPHIGLRCDVCSPGVHPTLCTNKQVA